MDKKILPADKSAVKFAVIRIGGKQYKVSEGQEVLVDKLTDTKKAEAEVLLVSDGDNVEIGTPVLEKAKVTLKVLTEVEKGEKVRVFKYKAKSRQRRHIGFRAQYTRLLVQKISN
ncbi:MAG: 50S ribosomal protein L21 [bacterium]|nr:MAG: 50S ribosomal protein L21 [bacterium]